MDSLCNWLEAARNRIDEERNPSTPGWFYRPVLFCRNSSAEIGSGEKNAQRLKRCSASSVSSAVEVAHVPETGGGSSPSPCSSLRSWWAFSANRVRYSSTLSSVSHK